MHICKSICNFIYLSCDYITLYDLLKESKKIEKRKRKLITLLNAHTTYVLHHIIVHACLQKPKRRIKSRDVG